MDRIATVEREFDAPLTPDDVAQRHRELVNLIGEIEEERMDQEAERAAMKERLAQMVARQSKLAGTIRRGSETRVVSLEVLADWETGTAVLRRVDTGEIVERRPLTIEERQMQMLSRS